MQGKCGGSLWCVCLSTRLVGVDCSYMGLSFGRQRVFRPSPSPPASGGGGVGSRKEGGSRAVQGESLLG